MMAKKQPKLTHIENVKLVPESKHGAAPRFTSLFAFVLTVGLLLVVLLTYLVLT